MLDRKEDRLTDAPLTSATSPAIKRVVLRRRNDVGTLCAAGPAAESVLEALERVITKRVSETLLVWPQRPDSVALFHSLAALNRIEQCDHTGLATVYFPWNRNTPGIQRTLLVDRSFLHNATLPALSRLIQPRSAQQPAFGYLMALHSLKHVFASGKKAKRFTKALKADPSLAHPSLFEIMPQSGIQDSATTEYKDQFLRRLRRQTWIHDTQYIEAATDPLKTPFVLFGVQSDAAHVKRLRAAGLNPPHGGRRPDLVLIDATRRAREQLDGWRQELPRFLGVLSDLYGTASPPALVITDDVFALEALRWEIIKRYDVRRRVEIAEKAPSPATAVLTRSPDPLSSDTIVSNAVPAVTAEAYGTDVLNVVEAGFKLRKAFFVSGDRELADAVTAAMSVAQSLVALPGCPDQFYRFLNQNYEGYERQNMGARFDHQLPIGKFRSALQKGFAGPSHSALAKFLASFEELCRAASAESPGRRLFDACLHRLLSTNTAAIVVCASELLRGFVAWRIENDPDLVEARAALGSSLLLVDRREAIEQLVTASDGGSRFEQIVFVEPYPDALLHVLTLPRLPRQVLVLAHLARTDQTLRRIRVLMNLPGTDAVRPMLAAVQAEFERVLHGRITDVPDLEAEIPLPRLGTLDLTAAGAPGYGAPRMIGTSGGLRIRVFDGSELAVYDPDALQVFSRKTAKDLLPGDQVCVFSPDFVGMARERLNLTANASDVLVLYHRAVLQAALNLPGQGIAAKVTTLRQRMLAFDPALDLPGAQAMRHWLDVGPLLEAPRDEVLPQAPRDRHHFLCFMKVLGISEDVARHYWDFGIFWTRSIRIRSGFSFHQVFIGILIDPHGTAAQLPKERRQEVWRIYEMAEQHVTTVVSNDAEAQP